MICFGSYKFSKGYEAEVIDMLAFSKLGYVEIRLVLTPIGLDPM